MKVLLAAAGVLALSAVAAEAGNRQCCEPRAQVYVRPVTVYIPVVRYQRYVVRDYCIRFSGYKR